jgi:hypothetical protein
MCRRRRGSAVANRSFHSRRLLDDPNRIVPLRWIVTGAPCSGTMYVAELLTNAQLPTAHEQRFKAELSDGPFEGESSSFAPLHFEQVLRPFWPHKIPTVVHLVRPPLNTIACMMSKKVLEAPGFAERVEEMGWPTTVDGYADFWVQWNRVVAKVADLRWRVDRIRPADITNLGRRLGMEARGPVGGFALSVTERMNSSETKLRLTMRDLEPGTQQRIQEAASALGLPVKN